VLAVIHVVPEAADDGAIGKVRDGDPIVIDADRGEFGVALDPATLAERTPPPLDLISHRSGLGRELFGLMRANVGTAEQGACALFTEG